MKKVTKVMDCNVCKGLCFACDQQRKSVIIYAFLHIVLMLYIECSIVLERKTQRGEAQFFIQQN